MAAGKTLRSDGSSGVNGRDGITFDGMVHMTGRSTMTGTAGGKTDSGGRADDLWKGAACTDADVNPKTRGGV